MSVVDYGSTLIKSTQLKEGGWDNKNPMKCILEKTMMILIPWSVQMTSSNKRDEPQGVVTLTPTHLIHDIEAHQQRIGLKGNIQEQNNSHSINSGDGGDEDLLKAILKNQM